jgi:anti-sigma regulatory factor (Ser/Thr protein kinase)
MTPPEAAPQEYRHELTAAPQVIAGIRRVVSAYVVLWDFGHLAEVAALCTSELLSNVAKHVGSPECVLTVRRESDGVRVTVSDTSRVLPVVREPDWEAEGGRGLMVVGQVADGWGVELTDGGKDVWIEVRARKAAPTGQPMAHEAFMAELESEDGQAAAS